MPEDAFEPGMAVRRAVLGSEHVDRNIANTTDFKRFQAFITRYAWGEVWTRPGLDRKTRSLLTIAMMASLGRYDELRLHVRATRNTGVTRDEVREVLLQVAVTRQRRKLGVETTGATRGRRPNSRSAPTRCLQAPGTFRWPLDRSPPD